MNYLQKIYGTELVLATDLYELTMAQGYWKAGLQDTEAVFNLFFRKNPFNGGFTISAGLTFLIEFLSEFKFTNDDLTYLSKLKGNDDKPLFDSNFLNFLKGLKIDCDIDAVKDGTVVFPLEPIVRVKGKIIQAQILESALLNIMNFHSLIATKAARVCETAGDNPVIEFGMRRAHGFGGAIGASWSAYIGGCESTSNVLAGKLFNIPVRGTHAHSWVLCFENELEAFLTYAEVMPNNGVFLVDTYDTIEGVKNAIMAGRKLVKNGYNFFGIRIDSGDLLNLSREARKLLDENGFNTTKIIASGDLDEYQILNLKKNNAPVDIWGIGTRLVTGFDQPALGGVYKLSMVKDKKGKWVYKMKISSDTEKSSLPGMLQIRRFKQNNYYTGDLIYDTHLGCNENIFSKVENNYSGVRPRNEIENSPCEYEDLLIPVIKNGIQVYNPPEAKEIRDYVKTELQRLKPGIKSIENPDIYPVRTEKQLLELRETLSQSKIIK
ncbi:MAG: nicotinate phosphoribosyltransferase [Verrucomicrobiia bacterium]